MSYKYDLAISFAGEQRDLAKTFADRLDQSGYSIFYDEYQQAELWGKDLSIVLENVYSHETRYCLIIVSQEYNAKPWTNHERQAAISKFIQRCGEDYILCLKVDDTNLKGYSSVIGYLKLGGRFNVDTIYKLLLQKLGPPNYDNQVSHLKIEDCNLAKQIITACFRRAIYSRMDAEIDMIAMYDSISHAIGLVQQIIPQIEDQALQFTGGEIIEALDSIQRTKNELRTILSDEVPKHIREEIDLNKQKVVRLLAEIRRAAKIPMQLPFARLADHFYGKIEANEEPKSAAF